MIYPEARDNIEEGDLIAVRDVHNALGTMTQFFTRSPYTHTGVAVWLDERLFMADLNSGRNALHAVSQLRNFDVFNPPAGIDRGAIRKSVFNWLANPINYGFAAFVVIGLKC